MQGIKIPNYATKEIDSANKFFSGRTIYNLIMVKLSLSDIIGENCRPKWEGGLGIGKLKT